MKKRGIRKITGEVRSGDAGSGIRLTGRMICVRSNTSIDPVLPEEKNTTTERLSCFFCRRCLFSLPVVKGAEGQWPLLRRPRGSPVSVNNCCPRGQLIDPDRLPPPDEAPDRPVPGRRRTLPPSPCRRSPDEVGVPGLSSSWQAQYDETPAQR